MKDIRLEILLKNLSIKCRFLRDGEWCTFRKQDVDTFTNCNGDIVHCEVEETEVE